MSSNFGYDDARYTIKLSTMMKHEQLKPLLEKALSTYPMYEPKNSMRYSLIPTREQLNNKILNHYKYREIGFETIGRFLDELEISMNEIMPYYYQLFKSEDIMNEIEDPFANVDIIENFEEKTTGEASSSSKGKATSNSKSNNTSETNSTSDSNNTSKSNNTSETNTDLTNNDKNVKSITPQGVLKIGTKDIDSIGHANEANWNEALSNSKGKTTDTGTTTDTGKATNKATAKDSGSMESESNSSGESNNKTSGTTDHVFTKKGNQGVNTYAHDMKELRTIFLNIEQMIINDERLSELFMRIY